ncbi:MAG TPA: AIR synthase-related protein [Actinomycetota bacterium]|nr:AIR synthase-related protein [Actinomycetota bacterium]
MVEAGVQAATDITGFGLVGHLLEMLGPDLDARLQFASIPVLDEAFDLVADGAWPGGSQRNLISLRDSVDAEGLADTQLKIIFDAQTSGGLLVAVAPEKLDALLEGLRARDVEFAARIGSVSEGAGRISVE